MKIEFRIDVTPGTARRVAIVGTTLILVGVGAVAYASQIRFTSGQTLTAADLNNNFDELYGRLAALEARPSTSAFCGATPSAYNGAQVGGYSGAKTLCTAVCGGTNARMCTIHDVLSLGPGASLPRAWFSGPIPYQSQVAIPNDCLQWSTGEATGTSRGALWDPTQTKWLVATCDTSLPVLCCK
jgi:hypothetical protein